MRFFLFGLVVALGCAGTRSVDPGTTDASSSVAEPQAISLIRTHRALAGRAGVGGSLIRNGEVLRLAGAIDATLPAHVTGAMKIALPSRVGAWLEIVAEGTRSVEPRIADRAVVHADALPATDVVHVADSGRVEELRVMRTDAAPKTASWKIARGPEITALRVNGARVEALDAESHVVISSEPLVAIDAHDVERTPKLRLEGDRLIVDLDTNGLAYPIVLDPSWIPSLSTMLAGRSSPGTFKLADGRFLVLGGANTFAVDIYDPVTDSWGPDVTSQRLVSPHLADATYTKLPTGKILVMDAGTGAELYDPVTLKSTATGSPTVASRQRATATLVPALNKVVVAGGNAGGGYSNVEVYDIGTGIFTAVAPLPAVRTEHVAVLLTTGPNAGKILLAGGRNSPYLSTAELIDPATWTSTPTSNNLSDARDFTSITLLTKGPNAGKYLLAGGFGTTTAAISTTDYYDPATNTFTAGPSMASPHAQHAAVALADGRVLIVSGYGTSAPTSSVEVFDPTTSTWTSLTNLTKARQFPSAAELSGGRIVVFGGSDPHSEVYWPDPVSCTTGATCPTGNCVDGVCCDTACTGQCMACDVAGKKGICSPVTGDAPHGTRTACSPYVLCAAGACATSCASDAACASTAYCNVGPNTCVTKKPTGSGCTVGNECVSGNCVDGYCCNSTCTGTCSACDVAGSPGTCTTIVGTPHGTRTCPSPYACAASGSCATGSCTADTDCASGLFCNASGACVTRLANGVACKANSNCATGFCVDGVCCDTKCTGNCQACDVTSKLGTCSNVDSGAPHGTTRTCAPFIACKLGACATSCASGADCTSGICSASKCVATKPLGAACALGGECTSGFCADGVCCSTACTDDCGSCAIAGSEGTCSPKPAAATCGSNGCSGAHTVTAGHCSGTTTTCVYGATTPCPGSLICADAMTCKTSCAADTDCTTGACDTSSGKCTVPDGGVADTGVSGPDAIAESPAPHVDDHPTVDGFLRCSKASDCTSGFCVDGVCCDSACTDKCHSCALLSSPGKCTLEPIGVDLRSDCGPANTCLGTCDGSGQCIGAGNGTMCGRNRCVSPSTGVGPAYCPAAGAKCPTDDVVPFECSPYICESAFGACRTSCASSSDCANGFLCDVGSKTCIAPAPPADEGGCNMGGSSNGKGWVLLVGIALALLGRRRAI